VSHFAAALLVVELIVCAWLAASLVLAAREAHCVRGWDKFSDALLVWLLTIPLAACFLIVALADRIREGRAR
jgi:hypothetical protein